SESGPSVARPDHGPPFRLFERLTWPHSFPALAFCDHFAVRPLAPTTCLAGFFSFVSLSSHASLPHRCSFPAEATCSFTTIGRNKSSTAIGLIIRPST